MSYHRRRLADSVWVGSRAGPFWFGAPVSVVGRLIGWFIIACFIAWVINHVA